MSGSVARIDDPVIAINIAKSYKHGMCTRDLYNSTRGTWVVSRARARKARYAFAVFQGVIREVYEIDEWLPSGSTNYTRQFGDKQDGRSEFLGSVAADEVRDKYVGKLLPEWHGQNPIRYFNC